MSSKEEQELKVLVLIYHPHGLLCMPVINNCNCFQHSYTHCLQTPIGGKSHGNFGFNDVFPFDVLMTIIVCIAGFKALFARLSKDKVLTSDYHVFQIG